MVKQLDTHISFQHHKYQACDWLQYVVHVVFQIAGLSLAETFVAVIIQIKMRVQFIDMNGVI